MKFKVLGKQIIMLNSLGLALRSKKKETKNLLKLVNSLLSYFNNIIQLNLNNLNKNMSLIKKNLKKKKLKRV